MKKYFVLFLALLTLNLGCNDDEFLKREPTDLLLDEQVWSDKKLVLSVIAGLYDRYPEFQQLEWWWEFTNFDEGFASNAADYWRHQNANATYQYDAWNYWDYGYVRDLNIFIQKCTTADKLDDATKSRFLAEARFLRGAVYFELVKRMGGVPLITEPMEYDFSGDPTYLRHARSKESEIYDFVISEMESIKGDLPDDGNEKSRASKGVALAMKSRASLYAASIARYGAQTADVKLVDGEVGIPVDKAQSYYTQALEAAQEIINGGQYSLYKKKPNLEDNFASLFLDKEKNSEVIFAKDYKIKGRTHGFTIDNIPRSLREENTSSGKLNPSLNLVQSFEKLDNTFATLLTNDLNTNDFIYYDNPQDIFAGRDARLGGTVIFPGSQFRGKNVDIWAGYIQNDGTIISADQLGGKAKLPGKSVEEQVVGFDGPINNFEWSAQTGFYVRKYVDLNVGSGQRGTGSDVWWIRYRYAEVLLNAAEAAFELGQLELSKDYLNQVRERAGFQTALTASDMSFDRIVHERKVELAFEGHILFDMKRWRLAHKVWNGVSVDLTKNPGKADEPSTRIFALWPYKVYNPGNPTDGKWVFKKIVPNVVTNAHRFQLGNYYSLINADILNNNPKIIENPNHN